jgi:hypothetical protein
MSEHWVFFSRLRKTLSRLFVMAQPLQRLASLEERLGIRRFDLKNGM